MEGIKDLKVLEKYLSEEELKEVAKNVAFNYFSKYFNSSNPHAKDNLDYYIGKGALEAVISHSKEIDFDFHAVELKEKVSKLIKSLSVYNLPDDYVTLSKEYIRDNKDVIINKTQSLISEFVNGDSFPTLYGGLTDYIGETMSDIMYSLIEEKFKK